MKLRCLGLTSVLILTAACDDDPKPKTGDPAEGAPVVVTNGDQTVSEGTLVTLDGASSSDPDGNIASFAWTQTLGPNVSLNGASAPVATFTAPNVGDTTVFRFSLTITDQTDLSASASVTIVVIDLNPAPVVDAGAAQEADALTTVTLNGSATDDGSVAAYTWTQVSGPDVGDITNADQATATFEAPDVDQERTVVIELAVTDDEGKVGTATTNVTVFPVVGSITFFQQPSTPPQRNAVWSQVGINVLNGSGDRIVGGEASTLEITLTAALETAGTDVTSDLGGTLAASAVSGRAYFRDLSYPFVTAENESIVLTAAATGGLTDDSQPIAVVWPSEFPGRLLSDDTIVPTAAGFIGGDIVLAGTFSGTVDFDFAEGGVADNIKTSTPDAGFLARYDSSGALVWVETITSTADVTVGPLEASSAGIFVAVNATADVTFPNDDSGVVVTITGNDVAYAKLSADGVTEWTGAIRGGMAGCFDIAVDANGNPSFGGWFAGTDVDFDPDDTDTALSTSVVEDGYVLRLDAAGEYVWHVAIDNGGDDVVDAIGHQGSSTDVMATGRVGDYNAFIMRFDTDDGNERINVTFGSDTSAGFVRPMFLDEGTANSLYIAGWFSGTVDFDPDETGEAELTAGGNDLFVARYNMAGLYSWVEEVSGNADLTGFAVRGTDVVFAGTGVGELDFDPAGEGHLLDLGGSSAPFVATRSLSNGSVGWSVGWPNPTDINATAFGVSGVRMVLSGTMGPVTADLDPGDTVVDITVPSGSVGAWAVKLDQNATILP